MHSHVVPAPTRESDADNTGATQDERSSARHDPLLHHTDDHDFHIKRYRRGRKEDNQYDNIPGDKCEGRCILLSAEGGSRWWERDCGPAWDSPYGVAGHRVQ